MPRTQRNTAGATKPDWLKLPKAGGPTFARVSAAVHGLHLATVCEQANCPNRGECWGQGTATVMILGDTCTRNCRFCAVKSGHPLPPDPEEPRHVAEAAARLKLSYVVITSVDRDDLADLGAGHFAATVRALHEAIPEAPVEVLTPDFQGRRDLLAQVLEARVTVFAHNIEVVRRLSPVMRDARSDYDRSLAVLKAAGELDSRIHTKSSLMVGLGETKEELARAMDDLREAGVSMVTFGQYLQPGRRQAPVLAYYHPDQFAALEEQAREKGFAFVAAGPHVRSSYRAAELFVTRNVEASAGAREASGRP